MLTKLEPLYTQLGRAVSSVNEKIGWTRKLMPQYPKAINFDETGRVVKITPRPHIRRIFSFLPYFVADTIYFKIDVSYKKESPSFELLYIDEYFDSKLESSKQIMFETSEYRGSTIGGEGKVEYIIRSGSTQKPISDKVFTAQIINKDRFLLQLIAAVLSAVITIILTAIFL